MSKSIRSQAKILPDFAVVLFCLAAAVGSVYLFYLSLSQTLTSSLDPVGIVTIKYNSVQRRMGDRVLWDRLYNESLLYPGDIIRIAELSGAVLDFDGNQIELEDNTLIRVTVGSSGQPQIELSSGTLNLSSSEDSGTIALVIGGRTIEAGQGTALSASSGNDGVVLKVSEGTAIITQDGISAEAAAGTVISEDAFGVEQFYPSVVVLRPYPNARLLKDTVQPLDVLFAWNAVNIAADEELLLEISPDRNFNVIAASFNTLDNMQLSSAQILLDAGIWNWRLTYRDEVLHNGRFTITEVSAPSLAAPAAGSVINYTEQLQPVRFQWTETEDASHYLLEIGQTPDFLNPRYRTDVWGTSITIDNMEDGTWYWRVRPVFPSNFEGNVSVSVIANFRIESEQERESPSVSIEQPPPEEIEAEPPLPPLAAPLNMLPVNGYRIGPEEIRSSSSLNFSWSAVSEANAYILTIYYQTTAGRQLITRTNPLTFTSWTLFDFNILDVGTFIWQVEAITRDSDGTITRRGTVRESSFLVDIPTPEVQLNRNTGGLFGN